jgi:oligopeptide/dipeptide ABC transporter ATP-binding protein
MRSIHANPEAALAATPVLSVEGLNVRFGGARAPVDAVSDLSFTVAAGECLALVGESGAGKSQAMLAVMGLTPPRAQVSGIVRLGNLQLSGARRRVWNSVRGARIGMIFQDPMSSLAPHLRVGDQIAESIVAHRGARWREARERARALLASLHVTDPARRARQYPHELSGGMRQRVMLAIALGCRPRLLIADEPTTALDVTTQAEIMALLGSLRSQLAMALLVVSHDLGLLRWHCDRLYVMYAGRTIEWGDTATVIDRPAHPYTRGLIAASRLQRGPGGRFGALRGELPAHEQIVGCPFAPRCGEAHAICRERMPDTTSIAPGHRAKCWQLNSRDASA